MKGMLLLLVGLALSAQTLDTYSNPPIPSEYLTMVEHEAHLNGYWWNAASATERQIYLMAWLDATGHKIAASNVFPYLGGPGGQSYQLFKQYDLSQPVADVIRRLNPDLKDPTGKGSADTNK
jgi:hypothetical protein